MRNESRQPPLRGNRPPPSRIEVIVPVWGHAYVRQFLDFSLPTLLAEGNVPALAGQLPTRFVVLTSQEDQAELHADSCLSGLRRVCNVDIRSIDHLIADGNYSTTITLALTDAVVRSGNAMLDTCFFFLVSDYVVANNSLANVLVRMQQGFSAVQVGNFQVDRRDALPWLIERAMASPISLRLEPREMLHWAFAHLHATTLANTLNVPFNHNTHTNRLFWRVDSSTMIGRFYLRHPICVRPERTDFVIGSSVDYSFIPELCPSQHITAITDSDEYLVVELQDPGHEGGFLRIGSLSTAALAKSLSEWTTIGHRDNVRDLHIYHCSGPPPTIRRVAEESEQFISQVNRRLKRRPQPQRGHPYWRGAISAFCQSPARHTVARQLPQIYGVPKTRWSPRVWWWGGRHLLGGRPPEVFPWHPRWPDYQVILREAAPHRADETQSVVLVSNRFTADARLLPDRHEPHIVRPAALLAGLHDDELPLPGTVDLAILELGADELATARSLFDIITPMMKTSARVLVSAEFSHQLLLRFVELASSQMTLGAYYIVPYGRLRMTVQAGVRSLFRLIRRAPWIGIPLAIPLLPLGFISSTIANLTALRRSHGRGSHRACSSFLLRFQLANNERKGPGEV